MGRQSKERGLAALLGAAMLSLFGTSRAGAIDLKDAVQAALTTNPEITQAVRNKEAIEFERKQAQGLYGPRVDLDASAGGRRLENATRRDLDIADDVLWPVEGGIRIEQSLFDFGRNRAELSRQASRTDGAAHRVGERAEFVALNVSHNYIDYLLQQRILAAGEDNVRFHERLAGDLRQGVAQGSISIADQQQAEERLQAARANLTEAREELENASIAFHQLTGVAIGQPTMPPSLAGNVPGSIDEAIDISRANNPRVLEALADIDAARAEVAAARAERAPNIRVEGGARIGDDVDGFKGRTEDVYGRVVMSWNIFDSGIKRARIDEMTRREGERVSRLHEVTRQAEADVRTAWNRLENQRSLVGELEQQGRISDQLLVSYREQFNVGRRSLLDVLDAQNTRYNVQVRAETARMSRLYAEYRVLAASNRLLGALGVSPPPEAIANAREKYRVAPVAPAEVMEPRSPYPPGE